MPPSSAAASSASASSTLVNVAEDAELRLVKLLSEPQPSSTVAVSPRFVPTCQHCIAQGDASQLLRTILQEKAAIQALILLPNTEEATSVVSLLAALLARVEQSGGASSTAAMVHALADALVQASSAAPETTSRTITLLSTLYNMRSNPLEKCGLLVRMMQLASSSETSNMMESHMALGKLLQGTPKPLLVQWLDTWNVAPADRRQVYAAAASGATNDSTRQRFLIYFVETYNGTNEPIDAVGLSHARQAALGAIRDPVTWIVAQRKLLGCRAIQALKKSSSAEDAILIQLLTVFQQGTLQEYVSLLQNHGGASILDSKFKLDPAQCLKYMRILSLCSLAADQESIPYSDVAKSLMTKDDEKAGTDVDKMVEQWVIGAVSSGLLSAKMDQLNKMVIVERCVVRQFDMEQWKVLQSRLSLWKQNVKGILGAYAEQQAAVASGAATATN